MKESEEGSQEKIPLELLTLEIYFATSNDNHGMCERYEVLRVDCAK